MADKLDKFRQFAQRLKDKVHIPQMTAPSREKVDQLITKYVPAKKVTEIAENFKQEALTKKVKELVSKYEQFTGVQEIMAIQNTVIDAQERFMQAQERRRDVGKQVADIESRLKELHADMQNTPKGDEKYLQMCTEEHKLIIQERSLRTLFSEAEREERELFATMSAAVKLGHERERAHAERNKYWYIVASIFGTVLGIAGSTINNRLKMAEFREMMEQQMARSASVMYTIAGGGSASKADITRAINMEFKYQDLSSYLKESIEKKDLDEVISLTNNNMSIMKPSKRNYNEKRKTMKALEGAQMAESIKMMQDNINHLISKQASVIDYLNHQEHIIETRIHELKRLVIKASQSSAKSDAELAKALSVVHQELETEDKEKERDRERDREKELDRELVVKEPEKDVMFESNQVWTAVGVMICAAIIFGNIIGRAS